MNNQDKGPCCNQEMIKGLVSLSIGAICIAVAYKIILYAIFFIVGIILIYYGLTMLKMDSVTNFADDIWKKIHSHIPNCKK